jgi:hypothetical protein
VTVRSRSQETSEREFDRSDLPSPKPLTDAVDAGVFGFDEEGVFLPSEEGVRSLTMEHACELASTLLDLQHTERCAALGVNPTSGKEPRGGEGRQALRERLFREASRLKAHYEDLLAAYTEGFGSEAASALDRFIKENCAENPLDPPPQKQQDLF